MTKRRAMRIRRQRNKRFINKPLRLQWLKYCKEVTQYANANNPA